jgi:hypothetical protein
LKTTSRPDVSDDLFNEVETELLEDGFKPIDVPENNLKLVNKLIDNIKNILTELYCDISIASFFIQ